MDIKELKQNVINEIKTKLASFFEHPEFEKHLYKYNCYRRNDDTFAIFKSNHRGKIVHFPLTILLDPSHEYTKRYVHHLIKFDMHYYMHSERRETDIRDYIDITNDTYYASTTLSKRSIETLLCMNMAIMSYLDIMNFKSNQEREMLLKFSINNYFTDGNRFFKVVSEPTVSPTHKEIILDARSINCSASSSNFGGLEAIESKHYYYEFVKSNIKFLTANDVRKRIASNIDAMLNKSRTQFDKLTSDLEKLGREINSLESKKSKIDSFSF